MAPVQFNPALQQHHQTSQGMVERSPKKQSMVRKLQMAVQKKQQAVSGIIVGTSSPRQMK
jgi:hypothetical protein